MNTISTLLILSCSISAVVLTGSCVSPSREGLPQGSPFQDDGTSKKTLLPEGIAIGDVTNNSALLWLRTDGPKSVQVEWASVEAWNAISKMGSVRSLASRTPVITTGPETDYTLSVPFERLTAHTRYRYRILLDEPNRSVVQAGGKQVIEGEFTTFPDALSSISLNFAWSGDLGGQKRCRQGPAGYPIFDVILAQRPDFFILLGDTIYGDDVCPSPPNEPGADFTATTLGEYRARHRYQRDAPALRRFLEIVPVYVTWDDHEVKNNFAGPFENLMPAGRQAFREYWPIRTFANDAHRFYRAFRYGAELELFLLDTRQYRSKNSEPDGPSKTMLGSQQLQWLLDGLKGSNATWKVIVSTVPLSIPKSGGLTTPGYDGWAGGPQGTGFERERQLIVDSILAEQMKNVVFLTGDVHFVQANSYDPDGDGLADFYEFVAGPLSAMSGKLTPPSSRLNPKNLINESGYDNFGMVHVSKTAFEVNVIDVAGQTRFSHRIESR